MFLVLSLLLWAVLVGLSADRLGAREQVLLLCGIATSMAVQYVVFGPS